MIDNTIAYLSRIYSRFETELANFTNNNKLKTASWIALILFFAILLFLLNYFTPMIADDFGYLVIYRENLPIHSLTDIFHSQYNHYMLWGGRSVVHFIAQVLLQLPDVVTDILNTIVYILYALLIYWHIKGKGTNSISLFMLVNVAIWIIQPAFGDTILWIIGSANYLWGTTIILLFLLPFRFYSGYKSKTSIQILKGIIFLPFAFLAGWTNENTAGAMIVISLIFIFYYRSQQWHIPIWSFFAIIGAIVGYIIMVMAPGNALRAGEAAGLSIFLILYRILMYTSQLALNYGALNLLYFALIIILYHYSNKNKREAFSLSLIYFVGMLAGVYAMIFSPSFPPRAWFGVLSFLMIALGIAAYNLDYSFKFLRQLKYATIISGSIALAFLTYWASKDISNFYKEYQTRETQIAKAKQEGQKSCIIDRYISSSKFVHTEDATANFLMWDYYGIEIQYRECAEE